jgi:hypothetical protein
MGVLRRHRAHYRHFRFRSRLRARRARFARSRIRRRLKYLASPLVAFFKGGKSLRDLVLGDGKVFRAKAGDVVTFAISYSDV